MVDVDGQHIEPWLDNQAALVYATQGHYAHPFFEYKYDLDQAYGVDLPRTLVELRMAALSEEIRNKPDWQTKRLQYATKWRDEALKGEEQAHEYLRLTSAMIDYVLAELQDHATIAENGIEQGPWERIFRSDSLVPKELREKLLAAVFRLEDVPLEEQDWHPNSNNQVLDLVHPSLYPIRYGATLARDEGGRIAVLSPPEEEDDVIFLSQKYCWLPSNFAIDNTGQAQLVSPYINNVKPWAHADLERVVTELVSVAVPLWEKVLSSLINPLSIARTQLAPGSDVLYPTHVLRPRCIWKDEEQPYNEEDEDGEADEEAWLDAQPKILPEAIEWSPGNLQTLKEQISLKGSTIQVIVKLANIVLTPEKPDYKGGSWHVEGMRNESIVSTFLYYYDEDNITESSLAFRAATLEPCYHGQDDSKCMRILYGIDRDDPCCQPRGQVVTKQGRTLAFPNLYQHQVQPFSLKDATKPGHRKIVALFLVDPTRRIPSTSDVAPQQRDWTSESLQVGKLAATFPMELLDQVTDAVSGTITREEAEKVRLDLMAERTATQEDKSIPTLFVREFSLCEH